MAVPINSSIPIPQEQGTLASNLSEGVTAGIKLATAADSVEASKQKIAEQKMELQQKQAMAITNRTKAAVFAQSPASFEAIMKGNEAYANAIGVPYNGEAIRAAWKDPALRLAAQREITKVLAGGQLTNPQAIIDLYGADSHVILGQLQDASYQAGTKQVAHEQGMEKQQAALASNERIAAMNAKAKESGAGAKEEKDYKQALRLYKGKFEDIIKKDREALGSMKDANDMLQSGNPIPQSAARRALAKAYNSGALTDNDVNDFAGSKELADRFSQFLSTNLTGKITDDNLRQLLEIAQKSSSRRHATIKANALDSAKSFSYMYGGDPQELYNNVFFPKEFTGATELDKKKQEPAATAAQNPIVDDFMRVNKIPPEMRAQAEAALRKQGKIK